MDGRMFDINKVKATFVGDSDFARAQAGEWILPVAVGSASTAMGMGGMLPGMMGGMVPGMGMAGFGVPGYPGYAPQ